jgi:hypothetical protein
MNKLSSVRGEVVDGDGRPVPAVAVVVIEGTVPVPEIALLTDDAGRFSLRLPSGRFTIEAHGPSEMKGRTTVEISGTEKEVRIKLQ